MRKFILGANVAYPSAIDAINAGAVGFVGLADDGTKTLITADNAAEYIKKPINIVTVTNYEGTKEFYTPFIANRFSYVKSVYSAATKFVASLTIPKATPFVDYTVIVARKGELFNFRNKWTSTIHSNARDTVDSIAEKIVKHINANSANSGMTAENADGTITFTASKAGMDYEIIPADVITEVPVTVTTRGNAAQNDFVAIKDMMMKAAADNGFEYTYNEIEGIYPALGGEYLNWVNNAGGYTVYTLKFTEPRQVGTRNDYVNQIVQIAYPTGAAAISTMDSILAAFAGEE